MYRPTIGLEVHAELKTKSKMFCDSANDPDVTRPNVNVCPVCLAHPGTLPVINREAVRHILRIGTAVGGALADFTEFDRKSYFYPDIPKGYQISQYEHPLISGGSLAGVAITRVHLEEDTARSTHAGGKSLVDFNRAGIPLMELVTEPVIRDAETAGRFAHELQLLLRTLGAGEANLEKGEMRIEANVSVSADEGVFGTKVEIKNLNSFRSVERAIAFEIDRQSTLIKSGGKVVQETRGWDESKQETFHQRFKEGSADYRYFPEPDLPKLFLSEIPEFSPEVLRASLPELPWERRARYAQAYALKESDAAYLCATTERADFFDAVAAALGNDAAFIARAANYIVSDLAGIYAKRGSESFSTLDAGAFAKLIRLVASGDLSSRGAKDTLAILVEKGGDPESIAREHGLIQSHDTEALRDAVKGVLAGEAKAVGEYRAGKEAALQYLLGKSMKATKGAGNPAILAKLIVEELG
ncbi:MAG TPA: Asp-tRNA(Asn)/Glu-tRNA(Gln) amidotransferase subunit GatB [Candidatus Paceibacterota bacterium]|nr:MAG: glutaminyl-tRNA synthase (glutamine-hydrolyzing) subunit B [Parcubacteria group bacterium 21-58-10]HQT82882.1 Asp-tRNA(Asn)/Glu-tRNA(Gln) amidotransferase subunit GatB [Candidatus Paceibacterota bacterium]